MSNITKNTQVKRISKASQNNIEFIFSFLKRYVGTFNNPYRRNKSLDTPPDCWKIGSAQVVILLFLPTTLRKSNPWILPQQFDGKCKHIHSRNNSDSENNKYMQRSKALTMAYLFENSNLLLVSHDLDFHAITVHIVEDQFGTRGSLAQYPPCNSNTTTMMIKKKLQRGCNC